MVFSIGAGEEEGSVEKLGQRDVIKYITQKNQSQKTKNSGAWILKNVTPTYILWPSPLSHFQTTLLETSCFFPSRLSLGI